MRDDRYIILPTCQTDFKYSSSVYNSCEITINLGRLLDHQITVKQVAIKDGLNSVLIECEGERKRETSSM